MAFMIIDRRPQGRHKSAVNRRRFLDRYRKQIKKAVADAISERSITDTERGEDISIPRRDVSEPVFRHGQGGRQERVLPGNKEFVTGDRIKRPEGGQGGGGGKASNQGQGTDEFVFQLSQEEYLDVIFEDLELPNLLKKQLKDAKATRMIKGGYTSAGVPARLNVVQSLRNSHARRIALGGAVRRRIRDLEAQIAECEADSEPADEASREQVEERLRALRYDLDRQRRRLNQVPFLDELDLKYNHLVEEPVPRSCAVMFCLLDVSGSMTREIKDMAKRFFILLHLFLKRNYDMVEVVFIRHHTVASEVDEEEFFYSRETGGTVVSSALKLMNDIIEERYPPSDWNIYGAQASDGDNWGDDSPKCRDLLIDLLLPKLQYFSYVEVTPREHQALWEVYTEVLEQYPDHFAMESIHDVKDIFPVFRGLFEKRIQ